MSQPAKTIFMTLSLGIIARNMLKSDVLSALAQSGARVVLLVAEPEVVDEVRNITSRYSNVEVVLVRLRPFSFLRRMFLLFAQSLVFSSTTEVVYRTKPGEGITTKSLPYRKFLFRLFGRSSSLKRIVAKCDYTFFRSRPYRDIFEHYRPSLLFSTNMVNDYLDGEMIKEARRCGITSVGMPKSWDALNKKFLHLKTDILLVWGPLNVEEAIRQQTYQENVIFQVGAPQFDVYFDDAILCSREEFYEKHALNPKLPTILFGSYGDLLPEDKLEEQFIDICKDGMRRRLIPHCNILIRPYHGSRSMKTRFRKYNDDPVVVVQKAPPLDPKLTKWSPLFEDTAVLANLLYHTDIVLTFPTTLILDAVFYDKPIVLLKFDELNMPSSNANIFVHYDTLHYRNLTACGGVTIAESQEALFAALNAYLKNPRLYAEGRTHLRERIAGPSDGGSGQRVGKLLLKILHETSV